MRWDAEGDRTETEAQTALAARRRSSRNLAEYEGLVDVDARFLMSANVMNVIPRRTGIAIRMRRMMYDSMR